MATTTTNSSTPLINYFSRDFNTLRQDLITYLKNYHSDQFKYLNANTPDMLFLELLAYTGDTLNYSLDKSFNEAFRLTAQSRESLVRIANDLGFYNFFPTPSSTQVILSINVPAIANSDGTALIPNSQYLFGIYPGMILQSSNGTNFECLDEVNFAQSLNRTIIPNLDSNGRLIDFTVNKSIPITAGQTKIQRFYVSQSVAKPFLEVVLDDTEITEVLGVVAVAGNSYDIPADDEFRNSNNLYVEVENLSTDKVFVQLENIPSELQNVVNIYTDMTINYGDWIEKPKRFVVRHDKNNQTSLIFGSTLVDYTTWNQVIGGVDTTELANFSLNQILNNMALGEVPPIDSTLFIKFRSGAGVATNVAANTINTITSKQVFLPSTPGNLTIFDQVRNTLKVSSNLPAVGGSNALSNEDLRNSVGRIFSANDRAVTYEDVKNLISKMPAKFGQPFRISYEEIKPQLLSFTQLQNYVTNQLDQLLSEPTSVDRETKVQEIKDFITTYPTQKVITNSQTGITYSLSQISNGLNSTNNVAEHALWYGEKCRLYVLGLDSSLQPLSIYKDSTTGVLKSANEILKNNIKNFLTEKRVIGDWIDITDALVVNFQVDFKIIADKKNKQQVLVNCLTALRDYFNPNQWNINQPIFISNVSNLIQNIEGVVNVVEINFNNIWGKDLSTGLDYSPVEVGRYKFLQPTPLNTQNNKYGMIAFDNVIVSAPHTFLSCKFPDADIVGSVVN